MIKWNLAVKGVRWTHINPLTMKDSFKYNLQRWVNNASKEPRYKAVYCYVMGALFCQYVFSSFEFYASNYVSVFVSEYLSDLGTLPTSLGMADIAGNIDSGICQGLVLNGLVQG